MFKLRFNCVSEIPEAILLVKHLMESYYAKFEFSISQIWVKISIFWESGGLEKLARGVSHHLMTPHDDLDPLGCDFIKTLNHIYRTMSYYLGGKIEILIGIQTWAYITQLTKVVGIPECPAKSQLIKQ